MAAEHHLLDAQLGSLSVISTGQLIVAERTGLITLMAPPSATAPHEPTVDVSSARDRVAAFVATTTELPADAHLLTELVRTDGTRTWAADDPSAVTEAQGADPTWLRLQAATNSLHGPRS